MLRDLNPLIPPLVVATTSPSLGFERKKRGEHQGTTRSQNKNGQGYLPPQREGKYEDETDPEPRARCQYLYRSRYLRLIPSLPLASPYRQMPQGS